MEEMGEKGSWEDTNEPGAGSKWVRQPGKCWLALRQKKVACFGLQRDFHTSCFCCAFESAILFQAGGCCRLWHWPLLLMNATVLWLGTQCSGWMAAGSTAHLGEGGIPFGPANECQGILSPVVVSLSLSLCLSVFRLFSRVLECGVTAGTHAPSTTYRVCGGAQNSLQVGIVNAFACCFGSWLLTIPPLWPPFKGC